MRFTDGSLQGPHLLPVESCILLTFRLWAACDDGRVGPEAFLGLYLRRRHSGRKRLKNLGALLKSPQPHGLPENFLRSRETDDVPEPGEITQLLSQLQLPGAAQKRQVLDRLIPLVYSELKALARSNRYRWRGESNPGTTSLVHEAYAKLALGQGPGYDNRGQFFALASKAMRSILIDNARWHNRQKRGSGAIEIPVQDVELVSAERSEELLALDQALTNLEAKKPDLAGVIECRVFGGLTVNESAEALDVSPATVKRRWTLAKTWLYRELQSV